MSNTIHCANCGTSLHIGDEYSEDGCPVCGGSVHPTVEQEEQERKEVKKALEEGA